MRQPRARKLHAHHWLILHGRYICKARKPDCPACTIRDLCAYKAKTTLEAPVRAGAKKPRAKRAPARNAGRNARGG